ncbi:MAG: HEAT repeat domain-containing protein [Planctomycetes bacterium]|nr:HEAT repeat domain-containing protein [Planctomycetota bacterium]
MIKTLLIAIGLACALLTATGIMWYNPVSVARRQLHDKDITVCCNSIQTLIKLGDRASIHEITKLLQNDAMEIRAWAVYALGKLDAKESIPEVTKLLHDNDSLIRQSTLCTLSDINAKEAIPEIKKLLKDKSESVRNYAEIALRELGVPVNAIEDAKKK